MKILHTVEFYSPSIGGMQAVVKQLSERMAKSGHQVTIATSKLPGRSGRQADNLNVVEFEVAGNFVRGIVGRASEYEDFLLASNFDIITNFAAQQWATDIALPLLGRLKGRKVFVPTGFSGLYLSEYQDYFARMKSWMREYDANVFLSNDYRDINFARENGVPGIHVIPNGAAEDEFLPNPAPRVRPALGIPQNHFLVLHVGSHTGVKGHAEAISIFAASKLKHGTLLIAANDSAGGCSRSCRRKELIFNASPKRFFDDKKIIIGSFDRATVVAAYKEADLFLFPSRIECSPLTLFECMASKTPFLTTDVGNAAEIIAWSDAGQLLPTIKDEYGYAKADVPSSADALESLYKNSRYREAMSIAGFKAWRERFTWEKIAHRYEKLYADLL